MPSELPGVGLVAVRDEPLSVDEVLDAVRAPECGGIALFVGVVRDHDHGEGVTSLEYFVAPPFDSSDQPFGRYNVSDTPVRESVRSPETAKE